MLAGHYAPALLAWRAAPKAPLWALLLAAQAVDVGFMLLGLAGIEDARLSPEVPHLVVTAGVWTHSLPMTLAWSVGLGALAAWWLKDRRAAAVLGAVVASHWLTDLLVHTPDLPLGMSQEPAVGLSLWLHPPWAWVLEVALVLGAAAWLGGSLHGAARKRLWALAGGLVALQTASEFLIPIPTSFAGLAASALALYAVVALAGVWVARGGAPKTALAALLVATLAGCGGQGHDVPDTRSHPLPDAGNTAGAPTDGWGRQDAKPELAILPEQPLDFGAVPIAEEATRLMRLRNDGDAPLALDSISILWSDSPFSLRYNHPDSSISTKPDGDNPATIPVGGERTLVVGYRPMAYGPGTSSAGWKAEVVVSYHPDRPLARLALLGTAVKPPHPVARIHLQGGTNALSGAVLQLSGAGSHAATGQIDSYSWSVTQPAGSSAPLQPSASVMAPSFKAAVIGDYTFCLSVKDSGGATSPLPDCVTVSAAPVPDAALRVRLSWPIPPGTPPAGTPIAQDLDLHFSHALAQGPDIDCDGKADPWFSNPFDAFWFNPNPKWGAVDPTVDDDPKHLPSSTDTTLEEWVFLPKPEGEPGAPKFYSLGVHHWNDHGHGPAKVTVTVFVKDQVAYEAKDVTLAPGDMWYAGKINWPNEMTTTETTVSPLQECLQSGDPCNKQSPGEVWQPAGERCVTPCYVNPLFPAAKVQGALATCP